MKVLVIGNCQARPIATLLEQFAGAQVLGPVLIHLSKEAERATYERYIAEADLVVAQQTLGTAWPQPLQSDYLREMHRDKTVIWPNIYFAGQQPYLRYMSHRTKGRVTGPLAEYHDLRLLRDWFADRKGIDFASQIMVDGYETGVIDRSLAELKAREQACDIPVSDLIENGFADRRLFFTFNHPTVWLLARLAERILAHIGEDRSIDDSPMKESLGQYQPPASLPFSNAAMPIQGVEVNLKTPEKIGVGPMRPYTPDELKQTAFACYDHIGGQLQKETLRITPAY